MLPVKPFTQAKSRLTAWRGASRTQLAHAFFRDTLEAVLETTGIGRVLVVTGDDQAAAEARCIGAVTVPDHPPAGLNAAISTAAAHAHAVGARGPIAVLTCDLPALRSAELVQVLASAGEHPRAVLADHTGQGTTLLAAARPQWLAPSFEGHSRHRHRLGGAHDITGVDVSSVQLDVDTPDDLRLAVRLGVGQHTRAVLAPAPGPSRSLPPSSSRPPPRSLARVVLQQACGARGGAVFRGRWWRRG
ncbi:2-phospho-L-lactate guanylyltransferase [Streptomyces sp. CA-106131]|uniref:2-phospho-L-lactate guanylyltransferase n=1 Tax=Streptomyces sp. CA-106131 TaxID=3240045 RepID=UPI003D93B2C1